MKITLGGRLPADLNPADSLRDTAAETLKYFKNSPVSLDGAGVQIFNPYLSPAECRGEKEI